VIKAEIPGHHINPVAYKPNPLAIFPV